MARAETILRGNQTPGDKLAGLLRWMAELNVGLEQWGKAEVLWRQVAELSRSQYGPGDKRVLRALRRRAQALRHLERRGEALAELQMALAAGPRQSRPDAIARARAFDFLALLQRELGSEEGAEISLRRALELREKVRGSGPGHPSTFAARDRLYAFLRDTGRGDLADRLARAARARGLATTVELMKIAANHGRQGKHRAAAAAYELALAMRRRWLAAGDPRLGSANYFLGRQLFLLGDDGQASEHLGRALEIFQAAPAAGHNIDDVRHHLSLALARLGRLEEASVQAWAALAGAEDRLGEQSPEAVGQRSRVAQLLLRRGLHREAEALLRRALEIHRQRQSGASGGSRFLALDLHHLGQILNQQGRPAEAEPLLRQALGLPRADAASAQAGAAGRGDVLAELALTLRLLRRHQEALTTAQQAVVAAAQSSGDNHISGWHHRHEVVRNGRLLGDLSAAASLPLIEDVLEGYEAAYGPRNRQGLEVQVDLLAAQVEAGAREDAIFQVSYLTEVLHDQVNRLQALRSEQAVAARRSLSRVATRTIDLMLTPAAERLLAGQSHLYVLSGFELAQISHRLDASDAVAQMAERLSTNDDELAGLLRERQGAVAESRRLAIQLALAVARPQPRRDVEGEARLRRRQSDLRRRLGEIDKLLASRFPRFGALADLGLVKINEIGDLIRPDEALLFYLVGERRSAVWSSLGGGITFRRIEMERKELNAAVAKLRRGLDPTGLERIEDIPPFDVALAHKLYKILIDVMPLPWSKLGDRRHLIVVPDGPLVGLPFSLLVSEPPATPIKSFADYRKVAWLARQRAVSVLPSVSALKALHQVAKPSRASRPFLGIGDPLLDDHPRLKGGGAPTSPGRTRGLALLRAAPRLDGRALFTERGSGPVDVAEVRRLPSLPDTADELAAMAAALKAGEEALVLRERASQSTLGKLNLADYRVISFATHGLMAGDFTGLAEPALVLTPASGGASDDDGLLTASEVAELELDAEWVILSACNTAAADGTPGGEGLSGLAKAFIYAGGRTLVVSHWPVSSLAAVQLTTTMLEEYAGAQNLGRAEALRRAETKLMDNTEIPPFAHPMFWAPFTIVGEGDRLRPRPRRER